MGYSNGGNLGSWNPLWAHYSYFFLLASEEQFHRAKDELAKVIFPLCEKDNLKVLHWFCGGECGYYGRKPLVNPSDMKGMMLRTPSPEGNYVLKLLGAVPASVASAEVYDAIAKGAIDGSFGSWDNVAARKREEACKYFTGPLYCSTWAAFMNLNTWKSLPQNVQKTIMEVARETEEESFKNAKEADAKALELIKTMGTLTLLSPEQTAAWVKAVRPTYDAWLEKCEKAGYGSQAKEVFKILEAAR